MAESRIYQFPTRRAAQRERTNARTRRSTRRPFRRSAPSERHKKILMSPSLQPQANRNGCNTDSKNNSEADGDCCLDKAGDTASALYDAEGMEQRGCLCLCVIAGITQIARRSPG